MKVAQRYTLVALVGLITMGAFAQGAIRIDSVLEVDRRIPIAVPAAATMPGLEETGQDLAAIVAYDLDFSGLFRVLPQSEYPEKQAKLPADARRIDFNAWRDAKAEHLVHMYVRMDGVKIVAECRLFDAYTGKQVVGHRLSAEQRYPRAIAHRFSEEVIRMLDGTPGIGTSEICFSSGRTGKKEIYVSDYDGANVRQLTKHNSISILPEMSPDGRKVVYLSYKERYPFLYVVDRTSGKSWPLSKKVGLNVSPAWAPDGQRLALVLSKDGNPEIYLINADGTGLKRVTWGKAADTSPTFSPDGKQLAFVSDRTGYAQIFTMNLDGSDEKRVSYQGGRSYDPEWSPDGRHIAYCVEKPGEGREIYVMDADGDNWQRLTNSRGANEAPSWSSDSRHIVFASSRSGSAQLWTVNVESGEERIVPKLDAGCQGPSWGPRRN